MINQLKSNVHYFGKFLAVLVAFSMASTSIAQPPAKFTFKLDQHETILSDQATLETLEFAIAQGLVDPTDPAVIYELERAELQQMMSDYNSECTLITSALNLRTRPTISIGNGTEFNNSDDLDPSTSQQNIVGFRLELGSTANLYDFGPHKWNNLAAAPIVIPNNTTLNAEILNGNTVVTKGNTLSINFGNGGLKPGQMAALQISLFEQNAGPNDALPYMNEFFSEDTKLTVLFQDPLTMAVSESGPFLFTDFAQYAVRLQQQVAGPLQHLDGFLDSFPIDGGIVIPEPGSVVLTLGSLGCFLLGRRRVA